MNLCVTGVVWLALDIIKLPAGFISIIPYVSLPFYYRSTALS